MSYNISELVERITDAFPDRLAVVTPDRRISYRDLDEEANRLAHHLRERGFGANDHIALHLRSSVEYLVGMLAAFKIRAVPLNINYRYVRRELADLYHRMDIGATLAHDEFAAAAMKVASDVPSLRHTIVVGGNSGNYRSTGVSSYTDVIASGDSNRDFVGRSSDDLYIACTGGTTGCPKGVVWRHEDLFFGPLGGGDPSRMQGPISSAEELVGRAMTPPMVQCVAPPLMHVSGHWGALMVLLAGGTVVLPAPGAFRPADMWRQARAEGALIMVVVGDAMLRPLLDAYEAAPDPLPSLLVIASGGAGISTAMKERAHELLPAVMIVDGYGSTETGVAGMSSEAAADDRAGAATFSMDAHTTVLDEGLQPVEPGSGVVGRLARTGHIPLAYYNDPAETARHFVTAGGLRWVLPGDYATREIDGKIHLLGRDAAVINTGGEKVFPEEVETMLAGLDGVQDAVVVGVDDDLWGQRVVAVVQASRTVSLEDVQHYLRGYLAGYKMPRDLVCVEHIVRLENGKADYAWARQQATSGRARATV
jgi:acyl-CoA synthetase (AMP-forming)/AMP-acid ligase II